MRGVLKNPIFNTPVWLVSGFIRDLKMRSEYDFFVGFFAAS